MLKTPVKTAPFKEMPLKDMQHAGHFDIVAQGLPNYCQALLNKLITLSKSEIKPFLQYQTGQLNNAFVWLNKLEKLIDLNRELFDKAQLIKIEKALMVIELLREESERKTNNKQTASDKKIMVHGPVNILADVFYQLLFEKKINGQPYLEASATEITDLLCRHFCDKNGEPLSKATIRTLLSPNKADKRPKGDKRISLTEID